MPIMTGLSIGSGGISNANFSNTATGTYSSGGIDYKYLTITSGPTNLIVTKSGLASALIIGGGGGGGRELQNGGAGQMLEYDFLYLLEGTHVVTIGSGGIAGDFAGSATGNGTDTSLGSIATASKGFGGGKSGVQFGGGGVGAAGDLSNFASGRSGAGGAGGFGSGSGTGKASSITGTSITYASAGSGFVANTGNGGFGAGGQSNGGPGSTGVVIIRVRTN